MLQAMPGYLLSGLALILFTVAILVTKAASNRIGLSTGFLIATAVNVVFAAAALVVQILLRGKGLNWSGQALLLFAAAGVFATYLGRWFFYESVARFGPARASIFQISSPLFVALLTWLILDEKLTRPAIVGMALALAGLALVAFKPGFFPRQKLAIGTLENGFLNRILASVFVLGLISSLAYAVGNVLRGAAVRTWPEPIAGALIGAIAGLALHVLLTPKKSELLSNFKTANRQGMGLFAVVGVANISGQICTIASMRYIPLSVAALVTLCTPLLVIPLSLYLFKDQEALRLTALLGAVLTLVGIALIILR